MTITVKPSTIANGDTTAIKTVRWKSTDGTIQHIEEMVDKHLHNAINVLQIAPRTITIDKILTCMKLERSRRQYPASSEIAQAFIERKIKLSDEIKSSEAYSMYNLEQ